MHLLPSIVSANLKRSHLLIMPSAAKIPHIVGDDSDSTCSEADSVNTMENDSVDLPTEGSGSESDKQTSSTSDSDDDSDSEDFSPDVPDNGYNVIYASPECAPESVPKELVEEQLIEKQLIEEQPVIGSADEQVALHEPELAAAVEQPKPEQVDPVGVDASETQVKSSILRRESLRSSVRKTQVSIPAAAERSMSSIGARVAKRARYSIKSKSPVAEQTNKAHGVAVQVTEYFASISALLVENRVSLAPFLYMRERIDSLVGETIAKTKRQRRK